MAAIVPGFTHSQQPAEAEKRHSCALSHLFLRAVRILPEAFLVVFSVSHWPALIHMCAS